MDLFLSTKDFFDIVAGNKDKNIVFLNIPANKKIEWNKGEELYYLLLNQGYNEMPEEEQYKPYVFTFNNRQFVSDECFVCEDTLYIILGLEIVNGKPAMACL